MARIIAFPIPPTAYPDHTADLDAAESVLLTAIRSWVKSDRNNEDPIPGLRQKLEPAGAPDAALSVVGLMTVLARLVMRPVDVQCPRCPTLSIDEKHLLLAASFAQAGETRAAEKVLRTPLLSAQGAEFAIGPLEGVGELFARARLFLSRRRLPAEDRQTGGNRESRSSPPSFH
jgi:hypothetical protein